MSQPPRGGGTLDHAVSLTEKRNVVLLEAPQALFQTTIVLIMTIGGLAGYMLAADKALATLPISAMSIGTAIATIPASLLMARICRRGGNLGIGSEY